MARIDAAEVRLRRERVPVLALIEDVLSIHREQLRGRRVAVSDGAAGLEVQADREILSKALEQFIDNACKYSAPGSAISVCADENLGEIVISIHNEWPAIRPADRERIFERFYRAEESRHAAAGTGSAVDRKKAAEAHGGRTGNQRRSWLVRRSFFRASAGSKETFMSQSHGRGSDCG